MHNKCRFPIWPATAPNNGYPVLADGGFYLPSGHTRRIIVRWKWTGRLWARTGCNFASNCNRACQTSDCDGRLQCNGLIGTPPATLVQISVQADQTKPNFYDVSLVDGYNLPVSVSASARRATAHQRLHEESERFVSWRANFVVVMSSEVLRNVGPACTPRYSRTFVLGTTVMLLIHRLHWRAVLLRSTWLLSVPQRGVGISPSAVMLRVDVVSALRFGALS